MSGSSQGLLGSSRRLLAAVAGILKNRLELLATDLAEEKFRISAILLFGGLAVFFLCFSLMFLALFLTALFWESRVLVLGIFTGIFLLGGILAVLRVASEVGRKPRLFSGTITELKRDWDALREESKS